ncbi:MAG: exodeoxyribonuclease V subunit alpha [Glaciecola sp.]
MILDTALVQQFELYRSSEHCMARLQGIEAIDYFFACQLLAPRFSKEQTHDTSKVPLEKAQVQQIFHILLALSMYQRMGNSCLELNSIAGKVLWQNLGEGVVEVDESKGFTFGSVASLISDINAFLAQNTQRQDLVLQSEGKTLLFTARYWHYEEEIATYFKQNQQEFASGEALRQIRETVSEVWPLLFPDSHEVQAKNIDWQALAVLNTMLSKTSIISGGAGTGKTYTAARVLLTWLILQPKQELVRADTSNTRHAKILLAAPTGKAAQRLEQSIDNELNQLEQHSPLVGACKQLRDMNQAKTLHRLLGISFQSIDAKFNENKKLDCDLLLVDEVSMVDIAMMAKLIRAMPTHAKLILLGDANQLPSVESGVVLKDLVSNYDASIVRSNGYSARHIELLRTIAPHMNLEALNRRQNDEQAYLHDHVSLLQQTRRSEGVVKGFSDLILDVNTDSPRALLALTEMYDSHLVNSHLDPASASTPASASKTKGLAFYSGEAAYTNAYELAPQLIMNMAANYKAMFFAGSALQALQSLTSYRCLTPTNTGVFGTQSLNYHIEKALVRQNCAVDINGIYQGLPIMVVQNDYRLGIYNGDVGIIWQDESQRLMAWFASANFTQIRRYSISSLPQYERVYAMTIHKTQGSEFEAVDLVLPTVFNDNLSRELLYTGVTRAKKRLNVISSKEILIKAIKNKGVRFSGLPDKLRAPLVG